MPEWINDKEWWRYIWGPLLAGAMIYFANVWGKKTDARTATDARLDTRLDKLMATQAGTIERQDRITEELRKRLDHAEARADRWERFGHEAHAQNRRLRHDLNGVRHILAHDGGGRGITFIEEPPLPPMPTE